MKRNARLIALLLSLMTVLSALSSCAMEDFQDILSKFTPPAETSAKAPSPTQAETTHGSSSDDDHAFPSGTVPGETVPNESYYGETIPNETFLGNFTELPTAPQTALTTTSDDFIQICPPEIKLDREMNIFVGTLYYDEWLEADDGDIVGTELYNRVPRAEHNLDIKLEIVNHVGTGTDKQAIMDEIAKRQESTDPNMIADLCSTYSMFAGSLTVDGRYQNIANSDYVNFDNPWWPADLLENSTIDDKVYFVSGDISPTMIYETYAVFFNPELIEKFNLDDPIKLVNEKRWTLDKVIEITSGIYDDLDEVSGPSEGDFFAFNFNDAAHLKAFPFGMGVRVIVPDSDDGYAFTEDYWGGKMENISNRMNAWIGKNNGVKSPSESGFGDYGVSFKNERCIFTVGNIAFATHYLSGLNVDYGIVPAPMFDEKQEQYYSYYGNPTSFWGIPTNAILDDSAALLEYLAADAYVYISPAIFERAFLEKYTPSDTYSTSHMFDIIRNGWVFDPCMMYNSHITGYNGFIEVGVGYSSSWADRFNNFTIRAMQNKLQNLVVSLRQLPY